MAELDPFRSLENREKYVGNVLVVCVDEEVSLISKILEKLDNVVRIHLISYQYRFKDWRSHYGCFHNAILSRIDTYCSEKRISLNIREHMDYNPQSFEESMMVLNEILFGEAEEMHLVHVCLAGPPAFNAAAAIAVSRYRNATLKFHYGTAKPNFEKIREAATFGGELCGRTPSPNPMDILYLPRESVDLPLLAALKVYASISSQGRTNTSAYRNMVKMGLSLRRLADMDPEKVPERVEWSDLVASGDHEALEKLISGTSIEFENYDEPDWEENPHYVERDLEGYSYEAYQKRQKSESVMFARYFIEPWSGLEWVMKNGRSDVERIRSSGKMFIKMFLSDEMYHVGVEDIVPRGTWRDCMEIEPADR